MNKATCLLKRMVVGCVLLLSAGAQCDELYLESFNTTFYPTRWEARYAAGEPQAGSIWWTSPGGVGGGGYVYRSMDISSIRDLVA